MIANNTEPWNKGRAVGQKRPFSKDEIKSIVRELDALKFHRDLCLFCVGIDTMLRGADLVRLKVHDLINIDGKPKTEFSWRQGKTSFPVVSTLTPYTCGAITHHVKAARLGSSEYLFRPSRGPIKDHISTSTLRTLVKSWACMIGLDDTDYSGHSLRRSKAALLYASGVRPEMLRLLLGHQNLQSTQSYLGIEQREALELAQLYDCFSDQPQSSLTKKEK